jgi:hypothetical protein
LSRELAAAKSSMSIAGGGCLQAVLVVASSAVLHPVAAPFSGVAVPGLVGASRVLAADAGFAPVVEPSVFLAGAFVPVADVPDSVVSFDALVGVCALAPHRGYLLAADLGDSG